MNATTRLWLAVRPRAAAGSSGGRAFSSRHLLHVCVCVCACACLSTGCASASHASSSALPPHLATVTAAPPPRDDGKPAQGGQGGLEHAAALEQLKAATLSPRSDRQNTVRVLLPDAGNWLRVKFWGVKSLVGFRYGKDHHAIVGGFIVHVLDESAPGACGKAFEEWAQPLVDAFEVAIDHDPPTAVTWNDKIVDLDSLVAGTATIGMRDQYAVAYGAYPAWKGACLVLGIAIPARDELERAKAVRDRFTAEVLPKVQITSPREPKDLD